MANEGVRAKLAAAANPEITAHRWGKAVVAPVGPSVDAELAEEIRDAIRGLDFQARKGNQALSLIAARLLDLVNGVAALNETAGIAEEEAQPPRLTDAELDELVRTPTRLAIGNQAHYDKVSFGEDDTIMFDVYPSDDPAGKRKYMLVAEMLDWLAERDRPTATTAVVLNQSELRAAIGSLRSVLHALGGPNRRAMISGVLEWLEGHLEDEPPIQGDEPPVGTYEPLVGGEVAISVPGATGRRPLYVGPEETLKVEQWMGEDHPKREWLIPVDLLITGLKRVAFEVEGD